MSKTPTEDQIKRVVKMLEETEPDQATRENAIKVIKGMKSMAGDVVDRIDDDLKSGRLKVSRDGVVKRAEVEEQLEWQHFF